MNGIILAGGNNTRRGDLYDRPYKAFEKINGKTIIERTIEVLENIFSKVFIVTNRPEKFRQLRVKIVPDIYKEKGPLGGIYTGLLNSETKYNFFVGCDMPFLNRDLIEYMKKHISGYDIIVPRVGDYIEPLHAIYSKSCVPLIKQKILERDLTVHSFFYLVKVKYIDEDKIDKFDSKKTSFFNINTEKDLKKANGFQKKEVSNPPYK